MKVLFNKPTHLLYTPNGIKQFPIAYNKLQGTHIPITISLADNEGNIINGYYPELSADHDGVDLNYIKLGDKLIEKKLLDKDIFGKYCRNLCNFLINHTDLNYRFVRDLVSYCNKFNKKLVHISTDYIYANSDNDRKETDVPVHHSSWYGYTKLLGDAHVELECDNFLICRLSHKPTPFPYSDAWFDVITNADYTPKIVQLLVDLINNNGYYSTSNQKQSS
mgnify:CR=1 FL=1